MTQKFRLDYRISLVTGAGKGIGFFAFKALAEAGAEIVLVARNCEA